MVHIHDNTKKQPFRQHVSLLRTTILALFLLGFCAPTFAAPTKKESPPPLVKVIKVTEKDVHPQREYVGHVEALQSVNLQARISGEIEQVNFTEGAEVKQGALLYRIEAGVYEQKVAVSEARVARAEAQKTEADQRLKRIQSVSSGGIPLSDVEAAEAAATRAAADLLEARALLELAKIDLGYTRILAPISGRIGATTLTRGNLASPASGTLAHIVQLNPIRVLFAISENDLTAMQAAQKGGFARPQLRLANGQLLETAGKIDFIDNQVDPTTGSIAVRALFDNPQSRLLPGQYVSLLAGEAQTRLMPVVPQAAVLEDRNGRYLLLVNDQNQVVQRRIKTGVELVTLWAVESGLSADELVIVEGLQKVRPGQTVKTTIDTTPGK